MSRVAQVSIVVNGEERSVAPGLALNEFLTSLDFNPLAVAVEYNGEILKRARYAEKRLAEGDRLEIVRFVQGG